MERCVDGQGLEAWVFGAVEGCVGYAYGCVLFSTVVFEPYGRVRCGELSLHHTAVLGVYGGVNLAPHPPHCVATVRSVAACLVAAEL